MAYAALLFFPITLAGGMICLRLLKKNSMFVDPTYSNTVLFLISLVMLYSTVEVTEERGRFTYLNELDAASWTLLFFIAVC